MTPEATVERYARLGLVVGKPLGVLAFSWLAVRLGIAALFRGVSWAGLTVVGFVAGIGFTFSTTPFD